MTRWSKVSAVASFEFLSSVKRPGYLIATFGMPLFILLYGGVVGAIGVFIGKKSAEVRIYSVVDEAGVLQLTGEVSRAAGEVPPEVRDALQLAGKGGAAAGPFAFWENYVFRPSPDLDAAKRELLSGDVKGAFVIPPDYLKTGRVRIYVGERVDLGGSDSRGALRNLLQDRLLEGHVAPDVAERVRDPITDREAWTVLASGEVVQRSVASVVAKLVVPIAFTMLLFISLMMSAGYLLQGTAIEKENRLFEVLMASANPDEILAGKLLGLCGAGLLQLAVWFGMLVVSGLTAAGAMELAGFSFPWLAVVVGLAFFLAAYLFLGSLMLGTGSLGNNVRESQQFSMVWTFLTVIPLVFLQVLMMEPHATLGRVLTWIPFTAPVTVVLRTALDSSGIAWWEIVGSFVMMVVSTWVAIRLGARLFRVGLLLTGARPKLREILRQARLSA